MGTYKTLYQLDVKEGLTDAWGKITNAEKKGEEGMKQYEKTAQDSFNKVGRHMDNMSQKMSAGHSKMHEGFLKMGESLPGIGRIAEYVTNPWVIGGALIAEGGKKAIESSAQFEHAFKPIRNMNLDKPMAELGEYKNQLRETAMATGQDLAGMSKAYFDYQSLTGKYGKEVNESMKKIGEFASFTDTPIIEATDAAASSMVAYGLTAKDTEKIMKSNFATVQIGLTTYSELSKVQREWAADASLAMGGTEGMDQANALYATMSAISKNPEMASIDTKTAMQSLGRGRITKKLKEVMGIDAYDAKGNMRSLLDIVKDVHKVYEKIGNNGKFSGMISELRGEQGLNHLLAMAGKNGNDLISTFEKFSSIQGGYNKEIMGANNLNDSLKQHEELLNKINAQWSKLGDKLMPGANTALSMLNAALEGKNPLRSLAKSLTGIDSDQATGGSTKGEIVPAKGKKYTKKKGDFMSDEEIYDLTGDTSGDYKPIKKGEAAKKGRTLEDIESEIAAHLESQKKANIKSPEKKQIEKELRLLEAEKDRNSFHKGKSETEALNGVTVGGKGLRNVVVNIQSLVGKLESHAAKGDLSDVHDQIVGALISMVRDAEIALATD